MRRATPEKIGNLQGKLYGKAKAEPVWRFYLLHDKVCRTSLDLIQRSMPDYIIHSTAGIIGEADSITGCRLLITST